MINAHKEAYEHNKGSNLDAGSMGSAAAMQVRIVGLLIVEMY